MGTLNYFKDGVWVSSDDPAGTIPQDVADQINDLVERPTVTYGSAPVSPKAGDVWIDSEGNKTKVFNGTVWVIAQDTDISGLAGSKNRVFLSPSTPIGTTGYTPVNGDLWIDSDDDNKIYIYNNTKFDVAPLGSAALADSLQTTINTASSQAASATSAIGDILSDDKVTPDEKYRLAKEWAVIDAERAGMASQATTYGIDTTDFNTATTSLDTLLNNATNGILLNMSSTSTISGQSVRVAFTDYYAQRTALLNAIYAKVKSIADSKTRAYYSDTMPTGLSFVNGDIWFDTNDDNRIYIYEDGFVPVEFGVNALARGTITKNTFGSDTTISNIIGVPTTTYSDLYNGFVTVAGAANSIRLNNVITENGSWTFSCMARRTGGAGNITVDICDGGTLTFTMGTDWSSVVLTHDVANFGASYHFVDIAFSAAGTFEFKQVQVEKGTRSTEWVPSAADLTNRIYQVKLSADSKNNIYYADVAPSSEIDNPYRTGDTWYHMVDVGGVKGIDGIWHFDATKGTGLKWSKEVLQNGVFGQLDAAKITTGFLSASRIDAGTITADKVVLSSGANLLQDPGFSKAELWDTTTCTIAPTAGMAGGPAAQLVTHAATPKYVHGLVERLNVARVIEGSNYRAGIWVKASNTVLASKIKLYGSWMDSKTAIKGTWNIVYGSALAANTWTHLSGLTGPVPSGASFSSFGLEVAATTAGVTITVSEPFLQQAAGAELIVDGAITTDKLSANAVTAAKIKANTITVNELASDVGTGLILSSNTAITAKVSKDDVINQINLSPEDVTISGNKINIDGALEISNWASGEDSTKIDGGSIYANSITANKLASDVGTGLDISSNDSITSRVTSTDMDAAINKLVMSITDYYALSTNPTTPPASGWGTTVPTWTDGSYIWHRQTILYKDTTSTETSPVNITGAMGKTGAAAINVLLSNESCSVPADNSGNVTSYVGTGTKINVFEGATELTYDGTGTSNGTWKVVASGSNITPSSPTDSGMFATYGNHLAMALGSDAALITYTISGKRTNGTDFSILRSQNFTKAKAGTNGSSGANGVRTAILEMYQWAASAPTIFPTGTSTYTWATGTFTLPTANGWTLLPGTGTAGQTLWGCRQVYSDQLTESTSAVAWSTNIAYATGASGTNGPSGINAIIGILSKESATVPADSSGTVTSWATASTTMSIYNGTTDDSANWTYTQAATSCTAAASGTPANRTATLTAMSADTATVKITASRSGYSNIEKIFTITKSKAGTNGSDGAASTSYWLVSDTLAIAKNVSNVYTPASVTVSGKAQTGLNAPAAYAGRFIIAESTDGSTYVDKYPSAANESSKTYTPSAGIKSVRIRMYLAGGTTTLLDEMIVPIVNDGATGSRTAVLTMYKWSAASPTAYPSGTASTYTWANGTFTDPGTLNGWSRTIPAKVSGQTLWGISKTYTDTSTTATSSVTWNSTSPFAIGYAGTDGTNAKLISLTATTQTLTAPTTGGVTTPATAVVTGMAQATTITSWEYSVDGAAFSATVPTGVSRTNNVVTITGQTMTAKTIAVKMSDGTVSDTLTVAKIADGVGMVSAVTTYQNHTNGTSAPTGAWQASPPTPVQGNYLWTRTVTTYTDNSTATTYSVSYYATDGQAGRGISSTDVKYQIGDNGTSAPVGTWLASPPTQVTGKYLWTRTIITYTDTGSSTSYSTSYCAADGQPGADAYTVLLSNESHTFAGSINAALTGSATSTVTAYKGTTPIIATVGTITGQVTGLTTAAVTNNGTTAPLITINVTTSLVTQNGTLTVPITIDGKTFTKLISWAVSYKGTTGDQGSNAVNTAVVRIYRRSAAAPSLPSVAATYTFSTGALSGQNNSWTTSVPTTDGNPLWTSHAVASVTAPTDTDSIAANEWVAVTKMAEDGTAGSAGYNSAVLYLYQRKASVPATTDIANPITYTFASNVITGTLGAWSRTVPTGTNPVYVTSAYGYSNAATDTIANTEWSTPVIMAQNGDQGTPGAPAKYVTIAGDRVFKFLAGSATPTITSITLTATLFGGLTTYDWEYWNGSAWTNLSGTQSNKEYALAYNNAAWGSATSLRIRCLSGTYSDEITIVKLYDGSDGYTPVKNVDYFDGTPGQNGTSSYLWIRYASDDIGSDMTTDPTGMSYIGTATTTVATPPSQASSYVWSLIKGTDGVPGEPGTNGQTSYLHIKYSDNGTSFTTNNGETVGAYIGTLVNFTADDSSTFSDYTWNLVKGATGNPGSNGVNSSLVRIYARGATAPALPTTTATYTFSSGALTGQGATWTTTVPTSNGNPLWTSHAMASATAPTGTDTIAAGEWVAATKMAEDGASGAAGYNSTVLYLYQRSATVPVTTDIANPITYTFSSSSISGTLGAWSRTVPAGTNPLYVTSTYAYSNTATDTIANTEWSTPTVMAQNGATGTNGVSSSAVRIYKRAATSPTKPSTTSTYTFSTGLLTGQDNGWTIAVPVVDGNPLWTTHAIASATYPTDTDTIATGEWAAVTKMLEDGATGSSGYNSTIVYLYQRSASAPTKPSVSLTYTFSSGVLSGTFGSWTQTVPSGTNPLYVTTAYAYSNTATDSIAGTEWSNPVIMARDGAAGAAGKVANIIASSQIFKSTDGGIVFSPDSIVLTPSLQIVTYSKWQYSTNGGTTWIDAESGSNGITIGTVNAVANCLALVKTSALYTSAITSVVFKLVTNDTAVSDTVTISKLYDVADLKIGASNLVKNTSYLLTDATDGAVLGLGGVKVVGADPKTHTVRVSEALPAPPTGARSLYINNTSPSVENTSGVMQLIYGKVIANTNLILSFYTKASTAGSAWVKICNDNFSIVSAKKTFNLTTDWQLISIDMGTIPTAAENMRLMFGFGAAIPALGDNGHLISSIMLEYGTKPTNWFPAPQDFIDSIAAQTIISDTIKSEVLQTKALADTTARLLAEFDTEVSNTYSSVEQTSEAININLTAFYANTLSKTMTDIENTFKFTADGLKIAKSTSPYKVSIDNDSLDFLHIDPVSKVESEKATISGDGMKIPDAYISNSLHVGYHQVVKFDTGDAGNTVFRWIGEQ